MILSSFWLPTTYMSSNVLNQDRGIQVKEQVLVNVIRNVEFNESAAFKSKYMYLSSGGE